MPFIPLERRFIVWTDQDSGDPEVMSYMLASGDALGWEDLLAKHRVVILAEAGSGKSTEMAEQARLMGAGRYTFAATVQKVGCHGLPRALGRTASLKLEEWRASDQPAWFFFDSVDEAKANDVRLEDALKEIAEGIDNAAARAHIVLSGRHTDWEFRRDLERLETWIAMPPADLVAPSVDPNELVVSVIRRDKPPEPPLAAEAPLVVVMGALSRNQVETFARGKGVTDVDTFFGALDKGNLWDFARRPLDLDWLVGFWRAHGGVGRLADMLALSLRARLLETEPQRARKDPINVERGLEALERIGAALVLQGLSDVAVPDSSLDLTESRRALVLAEILPDWSGVDRTRLIGRAVFDPASAGLARLHNDNQGGVRSFLTARWLKRMTAANCPKSVVRDLLFATTYDVRLVIPSMRQTAAWLSLWSADVAREVIARDARLLMDAGDPSSLSLAIREQVLKAVVEQVVGDEEFDIPDRDSLKRFALPDMVPCIRDLWTAHGVSPAVRELLLLMICLGELTPCADLAVAASFGIHADRYSQVFSGRALMAVASDADKRRYAEYVRDHSGTVCSVVVWDAVEALFPMILSVDEFLLILKSVDVIDRSGGLGLDYLGPNLVDRLDSVTHVEQLVAGLLDSLEAPLNPANEQEFPKDEPFLSTIEAAGRRLLELVSPTAVPTRAIDAALRLSDNRRYRLSRGPQDGGTNLFSLIQATPERRRAALWRAAERFASAKLLQGKPITDAYQIELLGFSPGLKPEDLDWLLADAEHREAPNERQIAANAALKLWRQSGSQPDLLTRIKAIGAIRTEVATAINDWTQARSPSEEIRAHRRELRRIQRRNAVQSAERDQSWRDFADRLRADPAQLRAIKPPTAKGVDARLFHLWRLLDAVGSNRSRYAIDDLTPLKPMLGAAVVAALRDAFIAFWRHWPPKLRCERPADNRNTINSLDCIGIVGLTLEAASRPTWAAGLSRDEAVCAAVYATLEINGFPSWFVRLAEAQPDAVREVLTRAIAPELKASGATDRCDALEEISRADMAILSLLADQLFEHLRRHEALRSAVLGPMLRILRAGYKNTGALASLLRERFERASTVEQESIYFAILFELNPAQAIAALDAKLAALPAGNQTALVQGILPKLFGRWGDGSVRPGEIPFESLERLVVVAFGAIRPEDDNDHSDGQVYSQDDRDDAEGARTALFKAFIETPGFATFDAIHRLMAHPDFPIRRKRMLDIARDRAGSDSEPAPWTSADVCAFESDFLTMPRNPFDLQRLILRQVSDIQHDLLNADYAQGATVARLPAEVDVQNWMADHFRTGQGRSYSIEREPHVVEEKEPDIRFRAKASDANVPMEIKVAESWSLDQLENALRVQLVGRYLRDRHNRYGILLLVHQKARPRGWQTPAGDWLTFDQVLIHLRSVARSIATEGPHAPQVDIAVIDVSTVMTALAKRRRQKAVSRGKAVGAKTRPTSNKMV